MATRKQKTIETEPTKPQHGLKMRLDDMMTISPKNREAARFL